MLNFFSLTTVPVEALTANGVSCGRATGFFYRNSDGKLRLITNWHVVTGRDPANPKSSKFGAPPCTLRCKIHKNVDEKAIRLTEIMQWDIPINTEDGDQPNWCEHPVHRYSVDVVAIDLEDVDGLERLCKFSVLTDYKQFEPRYMPSAMDTVFVIGYPWGLTGGSLALPLFKRGSIASDPVLSSKGAPRMFIDCRTTTAMSGSPVIVSHSGFWSPSGDPKAPDSVVGTIENFLGVYSGRFYAQDAENEGNEREISDLGIVWTAAAVKEIADSAQTGTTLIEIARL